MNFPNLKFKSGNLSEEEYIVMITNTLKKNIKRGAKKTTAVLLSGGIDSSLIVALLSELNISKIKTFTIAYKGRKIDESKHAKMVSKMYHTEHYEIEIKQTAEEVLREIIPFCDKVVPDASLIPTYVVCRETKKHVDYAFCGDGGDDYFGGYDWYIVNNYSKYLPRTFRKFIGKFIPDGFYKDALLNPQPLNKMLERDQQIYLTEQLILKSKVAQKASGLKLICPFLYKNMIEISKQIPDNLKIRNWKSKYILRKIAEGYLPKELIWRWKMGFRYTMENKEFINLMEKMLSERDKYV